MQRTLLNFKNREIIGLPFESLNMRCPERRLNNGTPVRERASIPFLFQSIWRD